MPQTTRLEFVTERPARNPNLTSQSLAVVSSERQSMGKIGSIKLAQQFIDGLFVTGMKKAFGQDSLAGSILAGASLSRGCSRSCMISPGRSPDVRQGPSLTARVRFKRLSNSLTFPGKVYDSKICCVSRSTLTPLSRISTWIRGRMSSRRSRSGGIRISNPLIRWYKSARNEPARTASAKLRLVAQTNLA